MTVIYVTEDNCQCYRVTLQKKEWVRMQKLKGVSEDKSIIDRVNAMETFLGKSQLCDKTEFWGAKDKKVFDGNTILLKISEENIKHRYVYFGGDMVCSFVTNDTQIRVII